MKVTKTGYVVQLKEELKTKVEKAKDTVDIDKLSYPFYQVFCDEGACQICRAHNRRIYSTADAEEVVDFPPYHPNCKCTVIGCHHNHKMDPWEQENHLWDFLLNEKLPQDYQIQLLRNYYAISKQDYTDTTILINLLCAEIYGGANRMEMIKQFIDRLNPAWTAPNLEEQFIYDWASEYITTPFKQKASDIARLIGVSPDALMQVMAAESRLDPTQRNPSAIGLIQFTDEACIHIGTTREALSNMSALEQLDYVYLYYRGSAGKMEDAVDLYWVTMTNARIGKEEYDAVYVEGDGNYEGNAGMDHDGDGKITRRDIREHLKIQLEDYWNNWSK